MLIQAFTKHRLGALATFRRHHLKQTIPTPISFDEWQNHIINLSKILFNKNNCNSYKTIYHFSHIQIWLLVNFHFLFFSLSQRQIKPLDATINGCTCEPYGYIRKQSAGPRGERKLEGWIFGAVLLLVNGFTNETREPNDVNRPRFIDFGHAPYDFSNCI